MTAAEVKGVIQWELLEGESIDSTFSRFDAEPLGRYGIIKSAKGVGL